MACEKAVTSSMATSNPTLWVPVLIGCLFGHVLLVSLTRSRPVLVKIWYLRLESWYALRHRAYCSVTIMRQVKTHHRPRLSVNQGTTVASRTLCRLPGLSQRGCIHLLRKRKGLRIETKLDPAKVRSSLGSRPILKRKHKTEKDPNVPAQMVGPKS